MFGRKNAEFRKRVKVKRIKRFHINVHDEDCDCFNCQYPDLVYDYRLQRFINPKTRVVIGG